MHIVLLVAHARGFAGNWRTPAVLRTSEARTAIDARPDEHVLGLLHLRPLRRKSVVPAREEPN